MALQRAVGMLDRSHDGKFDFLTLRRTEFARLDARGHTYLDYTGTALYTASQIEAHHERLQNDVFGNPHSENPTAADSTMRMERARSRVLAFFSASADEYDVIFTANASGALRLVGESFPFAPGSRFVLTADNHNSVNGIRRFAVHAGAQVSYVPLGGDLRLAEPQPWLEGASRNRRNLFAFPAQSNYSGWRHPLHWIAEAKQLGYRVLLDTAAFVPTCALDLSALQPDFAVVSFYKMFGFPTGTGALLVRREALAELRRPWFAGGTIDWVSTQDETYALRAGPGAFEDGTPHFLAFDAICDGLDLLDRVDMRRIEARIQHLTTDLLHGLSDLRHANGRPVVTIYGSTGRFSRGGTVAFNVLDRAGSVVPFDDVVAQAAAFRVSLRGGCFCNPGCEEAALRYVPERARACRRVLGDNYTLPGFAACRGGPGGAVRASVGIPTIEADIDRLIEALEQINRD